MNIFWEFFFKHFKEWCKIDGWKQFWKENKMWKITEKEWIQWLTEQHINPDFWCDYNPEDYGFKINEVK